MNYVFPWDKTGVEYNKAYSELEKQGFFESDLRIAVLGSHTLNYFSKILAVRLFESGLAARVWTGPYGQVEAQLVNPSSELNEFKPSIVLIVQELSDVIGEKHVAFLKGNEKDSLKKEIVSHCLSLSEKINSLGAKALLTNFKVPETSVYGSMDYKQEHKGEKRFIQELNHSIEDAFANTDNAVIDLDSACANAGKIDSSKQKFKYLGDIHLSEREGVMLSEEVIGALYSTLGKTKKCIVLDLDNTLWGGVIGEDGLSGIKLSQNNPVGKAFLDFQKEILKLHKRGIILAINSKNNPEDALEVFRKHGEIILKEENFAGMRINWQDKATNLRELASEINIGLDSMVFFDDDSFNIALVREQLPQVTSILLPPDPAAYSLLLKSLRIFDAGRVTNEDLERGKSYAQERQRREVEKSFTSFEDFLKALNLTMKVRLVDEFTIPRISQLSQRTNQFNMTTRRYSEEDIKRFAESSNHKVFWMSVKDKFGDYGLIGVCIAELSGKTADLDSFYMSCRVLGKGVENSFIWKCLQELKKNGVETVTGSVIETQKNKAFIDFYEKAGFTKKSDKYEFSLSNEIKFPEHINWE
ncbi:HAD-IIIC family phosphatase [Candidatus Micrarchaeota archaeon]|nr:HAD-IIIC family phosphatase [Candidatus Micrarchaeota archaeon]